MILKGCYQVMQLNHKCVFGRISPVEYLPYSCVRTSHLPPVFHNEMCLACLRCSQPPKANKFRINRLVLLGLLSCMRVDVSCVSRF